MKYLKNFNLNSVCDIEEDLEICRYFFQYPGLEEVDLKNLKKGLVEMISSVIQRDTKSTLSHPSCLLWSTMKGFKNKHVFFVR